MKKVKRMLLAAAMSAVTMGAFPQDQGVSMFIPGCCQTCQMLLVEKDGRKAEMINLISGTAEEEMVNGRRYKTLNANRAGLGTLRFRQESGKVYRLADDGLGEILCYDFGLKPDEEFTAPDGTEWMVLSARDTVMHLPVLGEYRTRLLTLCRKDNPGIQDTWQEGLGSWHYGPFTPDQLQVFAHVALLNCISEDQTLEFDRPPLWSRMLREVRSHVPYLQNGQTEEEWQREWDSKDSLTWAQQGDTLRVTGFVVRSSSTTGLNAWCFMHEGAVDLHVEDVPVHAYMWFWYDIDLRIPCHGEEIKKVEVRGNDILSSIRAISAGRQETAQTYDLQGRKVEGKPSRGIYVIGGKKRVVK